MQALEDYHSYFGLSPRRGPVSAVVVVVLTALALALMLTAGDYLFNERVLCSDVVCYYNYLPALFRYHSLDFQELPLRAGFVTLPDGGVVEKMSMGLAILYLPFYLLAFGCVQVFGLDPFDYGTAYTLAISLSAIVYFCLGMIFLRKVLLAFFDDRVTAIGLVAIFLGTNMVYYTVAEGGPMSHVYIFFLFSLLCWLVLKWHEQPRIGLALALGFFAGLVTLVRPTSIIILLFALFYGVYNRTSLMLKWKLIRENILSIALAGVVAILVWLPQMLYWKAYTGHFMFMSYVGEGFFWDQPKILLGLFSYRNGWLMYSPVMIFSVLGLLLLNKDLKRFRWAVLLSFLVFIYVIFSWWCWWWIGLGIRSMIDLYPLLVIPLCAAIRWIVNRRRIPQALLGLVFSALLLFGLYKNYQYKRHVLHFDGMTGKAYWSVLLTTKLPAGYFDMMQSPDYDAARKGQRDNN